MRYEVSGTEKIRTHIQWASELIRRTIQLVDINAPVHNFNLSCSYSPDTIIAYHVLQVAKQIAELRALLNTFDTWYFDYNGITETLEEIKEDLTPDEISAKNTEREEKKEAHRSLYVHELSLMEKQLSEQLETLNGSAEDMKLANQNNPIPLHRALTEDSLETYIKSHTDLYTRNLVPEFIKTQQEIIKQYRTVIKTIQKWKQKYTIIKIMEKHLQQYTFSERIIMPAQTNIEINKARTKAPTNTPRNYLFPHNDLETLNKVLSECTSMVMNHSDQNEPDAKMVVLFDAHEYKILRQLGMYKYMTEEQKEFINSKSEDILNKM